MNLPEEEFYKLNKQVGEKIRERRVAHGKTQADLSKKLGVTYQQMQKYENGKNRIYAAHLFKVAKTLNEPIDVFFEEALSLERNSEITKTMNCIRKLRLSESKAAEAILSLVHSYSENLNKENVTCQEETN